MNSKLCLQKECESEIFRRWYDRIKEPFRLHRKQWEFAYIAQALYEAGLLEEGRRGLVFGVGNEPLPALFASMGCYITATDQSFDDAKSQGWDYTHSKSHAELNNRGLCDKDKFDSLVEYRVPVDMNNIPSDLRDYDFVWSSCSLEHLGTIEAGLKFMINAMDCVKPGGLAVHTTEYNCSPPRKEPMSEAARRRRRRAGIDPDKQPTIESGPIVMFRKCDIDDLALRLQNKNCRLVDFDDDTGSDPADKEVAMPPYPAPCTFISPDIVHLKLDIGGYVSTSAGFVIESWR